MISPRAAFGLLLTFAGVCTIASTSRGADVPPPVTDKSPVRIWPDQIGYRPQDPKVVIVAGDNPLPADLPLQLSVHDVKSDKQWPAKDFPLQPFNKGKKDSESGEFTAHLDLGKLKDPGRYYVQIGDGPTAQRSYAFNIADDVYRGPAVTAWRMFYYQRADTDKPERYAGPWNHKLAFRGPGQATEAKVYQWNGKTPHWDPVGKDVADPTPRDVTGGWWDAGDFNKYLGNTTKVHNFLLLGVQLLGDRLADNQFNLPESGNGVPDALDEVRWGTEFILRMADETGAAFGKAHEKGNSPPDKETSPVQLTRPTSGATMNRACALAYAAVVWKEKRPDDPFSGRCLDAATKSWKLLQAKPHPWPADPKNPAKTANTGAWYEMDYDASRALAAACFFRLTGEDGYHQIIKDYLSKQPDRGPGEGVEWWPTFQVYAGTKDADPALVRKAKGIVTKSAKLAVEQTGEDRGYAAGVRGYWCGSNRLVGECGVNCLLAAQWAEGNAKQQYEQAALEYVHYLFGRNPVGRCYLTNMKEFGAENSVMVMFHSWLGPPDKRNDPYASRFIGDGPGKVGPPPGFVVGGANGGMKRYNNTLDNEPWVFSEPDIDYQAPAAVLIGYFGLRRQ